MAVRAFTVENLGMSGSLKDVFGDRLVLVTGHTGFKGSWLTLWLTQLGARVTGYALAPPTSPSNFEVSRVRDVLTTHYEADVRDTDRLSQAIRTATPSVIFHLAAQPLVRDSYQDPRETFDVNVMGTVTLLDCVRNLRHSCVIVVVTSDKCYENREQTEGYKESDPMGGFDPYSASKGAAEIAIASYRRSFFNPAHFQDHGVKLASARAGNVIGGGDWAPDRIGTDIVNALCVGEPVQVRNPHAIRPWQHVLESLNGYLTLAACMLNSNDSKWCSPWNFGPSLKEQLTVLELVKLYCSVWGQGTWKDVSHPSAPHEAGILQLNIDKAERDLGWKPRWTIAETVSRTADWYKAFHQKPDASMCDHCLGDITAYESAESRSHSKMKQRS